MHRATAIGALIGIVLAVEVAIPRPAAAAGTEVLVVQAETTSLSPIPLQGGSGSYTLTSAGVCTVVDADRDGDGGSCSLSSTGNYTSPVCGVANFRGSATVTASGLATQVDYQVVEVGGIGVLTGSATEQDGTSGTIAGVLAIRPLGAPSPSTCAVGLSLDGVAVMDT